MLVVVVVVVVISSSIATIIVIITISITTIITITTTTRNLILKRIQLYGLNLNGPLQRWYLSRLVPHLNKLLLKFPHCPLIPF